MPIEFLGMGATHDGSESNRRSNGSFDPEFTIALARAHEENGWDRVLTAYGAGSPDPAQAAAWIAMHTTTLEVLLAHRPNLSIPTFAAKTFATIDHMSNGRLKVHFITGGNDHEHQREGDFLGHDERYDRALFTTTAKVTGASGNSNALVGTPETVAAALMDYVHLGVDILSARGYDTLQDTID